jgi:hypothetical protein
MFIQILFQDYGKEDVGNVKEKDMGFLLVIIFIAINLNTII